MTQKAHMACNVLSKLKDISRSQAVYTVNVVIYIQCRKRCNVESLLLQTTNSGNSDELERCKR